MSSWRGRKEVIFPKNNHNNRGNRENVPFWKPPQPELSIFRRQKGWPEGRALEGRWPHSCWAVWMYNLWLLGGGGGLESLGPPYTHSYHFTTRRLNHEAWDGSPTNPLRTSSLCGLAGILLAPSCCRLAFAYLFKDVSYLWMFLGTYSRVRMKNSKLKLEKDACFQWFFSAH